MKRLDRTLTFRLVATSVVWVAASVFAAGLLLAHLFHNHIERRFDLELLEHLDELVAASELSTEKKFTLSWIPSEPRFNRPHSGWYWQISLRNTIAARSKSLWLERLPVVEPEQGVRPVTQFFSGPGEERMRALVQDITLPEADEPFTFVVAGPISDIQRDVDRFVMELTVTLSALGLGLVAAVLFQIRFGLRPLHRMKQFLTDIRAGRANRLPEAFPEEVQPVATELNALLDHNTAMLDRARTQAGNLAHALKNPLTVIQNELRAVEGERGQLLREQVSVVSKHIDRYLARARAAGAAGVLGARAPVKEAIEELRFSMELIHKDRSLNFRISGTDGLFFQGDPHDLEEMIGNLLDNACKWGRHQVAVTAKQNEDRLIITVEDDGPGIPQERRTDVLRRGRQLDEAVPGSGLGLDIVQDLALLYRGSMTLQTSHLGGVSASLELPAAD